MLKLITVSLCDVRLSHLNKDYLLTYKIMVSCTTPNTTSRNQEKFFVSDQPPKLLLIVLSENNASVVDKSIQR